MFAIVDPFSSSGFLVQKLKAQGISICAVFSRADIEDFWGEIDPKDFERVFKDFQDAHAFFKDHKPQAVLAGAESGVYVAEQLAKALDLPTNDPSTTIHRRDKWHMQDTLKAKGIRHIPTQIIDAHSTIKSNSSFDRYLFKPIDGAGSDNLHICDAKDLETAKATLPFGQINPLTHAPYEAFLLQPYLQGIEFVVDLVVSEGVVIVSALSRYHKITLNGIPAIYESLDVLDPNDSSHKDLIDFAHSCTKALGFTQGAVHMEIMQEGEAYYMIEAGARLHGGIAPDLFEHCYAPSLLDNLICAYQNPKVLTPAKLIKHGKIVFIASTSTYVMPDDTTAIQAQLQTLQSFKTLKLFYKSGQSVTPTKDLLSLVGIMAFAHEGLKTLEQDIKQSQRLMKSFCK